MEIEIQSLPLTLAPSDAVEVAYRQDLDWVEEKLNQGLSVLIECDKQLTNHVYRALRARLRRGASPKRLNMISGHQQDPNELSPQSRMQRIIKELQEVVFEDTEGQIITLPHLDVLTTTTRSGLNMETREVATLLYENSEALFLAFKDPSFELPQVIERLFTARRALVGIRREALPQLITQREARKFGVTHINPYRLYKYLSGLNALRCRELLSHFQDRLDYSEHAPEQAEALYHELRQMTLVEDVELPNVDLERDIGGYAEVKAQIRSEVLDLLGARERLSDPQEVKQLEALIPKGMIFHGPPGTGKTYFCKAMATALDATILIVSGPELKSKWVGESEENLRRVFAQARRSAPSIIVFDELDAFASARGTYTGSGVEHSMVNQLLTEMDGFRQEELVFVVGTTNFMSSLDPALLRPGRFEMNIHIPYPTENDRREIVTLYRDKLTLPLSDTQLETIAQETGGLVEDGQGARYSGDHLYAIMRALKRAQVRAGASFELTDELLSDTLKLRKKERSKLNDAERRAIAVHEAGHAICAYVLPRCAKIKEVSVATNSAEVLGYLARSSRENRYVTTREELLEDICVLLGGRLAEELVFGESSTGAFDDLQRATGIARSMVEELGMSERMGLRTFVSSVGGASVLGGERAQLSEELSQQLDGEISAIIEAQRERAQQILQERRAGLDAIAEHLVAYGRCDLATLKGLLG